MCSSENVMGDVVLFTPPPASIARDCLVDRVGDVLLPMETCLSNELLAAGPGDVVAVESSGAITINGAAPKENESKLVCSRATPID
jgi:hypothetical protein